MGVNLIFNLESCKPKCESGRGEGIRIFFSFEPEMKLKIESTSICSLPQNEGGTRKKENPRN